MKELCQKFHALIQKEAVHENEPQRILYLLRIQLLFLELYFLLISLALCVLTPLEQFWIGLIFAGLNMGLFYVTYKARVYVSVILCVSLQLTWLVFIVLMFGWDCGIQHMMFEMLVLVYFAVYNSLFGKILYTLFLFSVRLILFIHCRMYLPRYFLNDSVVVFMQITSMIITFVLMGITCGMLSSNVESAEKKLVLYNESLKRQAATDPLTGLWNRRQMLKYITECRKDQPQLSFSLGMGDIDFFKKINDRWGHDCGDAVLVWITDHMKTELSEKARLCRWGGEEFIFFFPGQNGDEVCEALNALRMHLDNHPFDWKGEWIPVTMTFGVEENDFTSSLDTLLKRVDDKLYMGKEQGRDRVIY